MKSVLLSIKPKWCELIANGKMIDKVIIKSTDKTKIHIDGVTYDLDNVIAAIEKQIPKKPEGIYDDNAGIEAESKYELCLIGHCTVCGREVQQGMNYCMNCGQALDWGDNK